jgi:lysine-specific demethylase 8
MHAQVVGRKYVRLYSPEHNEAMYPFTDGLTTNSSQVDLHEVDAAAFPAFNSAPFVDCVLEPGQMLYIPPGWWHFVQSMSMSFSVSFWWR